MVQLALGAGAMLTRAKTLVSDGGALLNKLIANVPESFQGLVTAIKQAGYELTEDAGKISIRNKGRELAYALEKKFFLKHNGWGGDREAVEGKTVTILGKFDPVEGSGTRQLIETGLTKSGVPGKEIGKQPFNVLSDDQITTLMNAGKYEEAWALNKKWLDDAIDRGDNIRLIADPLDVKNVYLPQSTIKSFFGREIEYLTKGKGYIISGNLISRK